MPAPTDNCQVNGFHCAPEDLCAHCKGTGAQQPPEMCCSCNRCFDDVIGWSTGIESGTTSQAAAREYVEGVNNGQR